jgi:ABC-type molybdenum transport system ATPase subunit/photorepair protein PhrA
MEIKIGMVEMTLDNVKTAQDYNKCMKTITRGLFQTSGLYQNDCDINAMAENLQRFLVENPQFVVGLVNAGKIKI